MRNIIIVLFLFLLQSCSTGDKVVNIEGIKFVVPSGFVEIKPDTENKEILRMMYKDEMYISVQDDIGKNIKNNLLGEEATTDMVHVVKFSMFVKGYNGYNKTQRKSYKVNGRKVTEQEFSSKTEFGEVYFKYCIVETEKTFLEVLFSGKINLKSDQDKICKMFIKNIDYNPKK